MLLAHSSKYWLGVSESHVAACRDMRFPTMWYVRPAKAQISLRAYAQSDQSLCYSLEYSMTVKLLTKHHLEFLSLKGNCTGLSESTLVKIPYCWKSHVAAQIIELRHEISNNVVCATSKGSDQPARIRAV